MQRKALRLRQGGKSIGFVPTMGALHEGHLSLIRRSNRENDFTIVSIFVNPLQFGPNEDFAKYPRTLPADKKLIDLAGGGIVFVPDTNTFYPPEFTTAVSVPSLSDRLEGISRPGHFDGVCTVVMKLLQLTQPHRMYLGQKDFQQAVILRRMVEDLALPVQTRILPIVRETDGLALSSRNRYLNIDEREQSAVLFQILKEIRKRIHNGERSIAGLKRQARKRIAVCDRVKLEYLEVVHADTLKPARRLQGNVAWLIAARVGTTRLIDNICMRVS